MSCPSRPASPNPNGGGGNSSGQTANCKTVQNSAMTPCALKNSQIPHFADLELPPIPQWMLSPPTGGGEGGREVSDPAAVAGTGSQLRAGQRFWAAASLPRESCCRLWGIPPLCFVSSGGDRLCCGSGWPAGGRSSSWLQPPQPIDPAQCGPASCPAVRRSLNTSRMGLWGWPRRGPGARQRAVWLQVEIRVSWEILGSL